MFDNQGYASIRATQKKFFNGGYIGCDPETGLGFPNWEKLFDAYEIPCRYIKIDETSEDSLRELLSNSSGPEAWIVRVDPHQPNWPAVSTVIGADGSLTSSPLYEMLPKLSEKIRNLVCRFVPTK